MDSHVAEIVTKLRFEMSASPLQNRLGLRGPGYRRRADGEAERHHDPGAAADLA